MKTGKGSNPNSVPKQTSRHPWRGLNSTLKNYSHKTLAQKREERKKELLNQTTK